MIYSICYELIKSCIFIIILHYLFLHIKNLFTEVYEFNPIEIPLKDYIIPHKKERNTTIIEKEGPTTTDKNTLTEKPLEINGNGLEKNQNIKEELLNFVNNSLDEPDDNEDVNYLGNTIKDNDFNINNYQDDSI